MDPTGSQTAAAALCTAQPTQHRRTFARWLRKLYRWPSKAIELRTCPHAGGPQPGPGLLRPGYAAGHGAKKDHDCRGPTRGQGTQHPTKLDRMINWLFDEPVN